MNNKEVIEIVEGIFKKNGMNTDLFSAPLSELKESNFSLVSVIWEKVVELEGCIDRIEAAKKSDGEQNIPRIRTLLYTILVMQMVGSTSKYPKRFMKKSELEEMGFSDEYLMYAYRSRNNNFASKNNPTKKNSAIFFDTAGFEAWRQRDIKAQVKAMPRG